MQIHIHNHIQNEIQNEIQIPMYICVSILNNLSRTHVTVIIYKSNHLYCLHSYIIYILGECETIFSSFSNGVFAFFIY